LKVLVVMVEADRAEALAARFRRRLPYTLDFRHASSVAEALAQMRARVPDIVVSAQQIGGVGALELLQRLRRDSKLREVPLVLLGKVSSCHFSPSRLEAVLNADAHPADVLEAAFTLLITNGRFHEEKRPCYGLSGRALRSREVKVSGTLEVMTLFDLVLSLTQKRNSGRLYLLFGGVEALLVLQQGRFVHAEYQEKTGERAVLHIFQEAERHPEAEFFFEPSPLRLPPEGMTLHAPVQELLLRVAVALDHRREPSAAGVD
jgi:CheY-like chemotaxis protein